MRSETRCVTEWADEWAVHMYEEGDSSLKRYAACCSRLYPCEKNPNSARRHFVAGWERKKAQRKHLNFRDLLSVESKRILISHRGLRWTSQVPVQVKAPFGDLMCM